MECLSEWYAWLPALVRFSLSEWDAKLPNQVHEKVLAGLTGTTESA